MGDDDRQVLEGRRFQLEEAELLHRGSSVAQADVYVAAQDGRSVLIKTFRSHAAVIRWTWGRWVLQREKRLLTRLRDVQGIPIALGFYQDETALAIEYIAGAAPLVDSRETSPECYPPIEFFEQLRELLDTMHRHGVAHGDIRRKNILVDGSGRPHIIDFATAIECSLNTMNPSRLIYRMVLRADLFSALKIQHSYYPESLNEKDQEHIFERPWYVSLGSFLRKNIYRKLIKQKHWRERWRRLTRSSALSEPASPPVSTPLGRRAQSLERKVN